MKNKKVQAIFSLLLVGAMLAGCGNAEVKESSSAGKSEVEGEEVGYTLPIGNGTTDSISMACYEGWYAAVTLNDNLPSWQAIEEQTGVKIEWEAIADYDTVMQPRIASGQDLPDIFVTTPSWGNSGVYELAQDGVIKCLDDLIPKYAPNVQKVLDEDPELKAYLTAPDGHIYTLCDTPKYVNDYVVQSALMIRQDWLDTLGLDMPVTMDDWYKVLTAFKNDDPNGNGIQDEIPLSGTNAYSQAKLAFATAYDYPQQCPIWWYDDNGEVFSPYLTDAYKDFMAELSKWYAEGLIDAEINRTEADMMSLVATDTLGASMALNDYCRQNNATLAAAGSDGKYVLVDAPKGTGETEYLRRDPVWNHYGFPTTSDKTEMALKWFDYVWAGEGQIYVEWGIEGETWEWVDGERQYTDFILNNPDGLDPYNALRSYGSSNTVVSRTPIDAYLALNVTNKDSQAWVADKKMIEPFPQVMPLPEEQEIINMYQTDFTTYVEEGLAKFFTGVESFDGWDAFVEGANALHYEDIREVKQAQYDRFQEAMK